LGLGRGPPHIGVMHNGHFVASWKRMKDRKKKEGKDKQLKNKWPLIRSLKRDKRVIASWDYAVDVDVKQLLSFIID
jgi:hypothetical protein